MGTLPLFVDTNCLAIHLKDPDLRIFDSTTNISREPGKPDRVVVERARSLSVCRPTSPITTAI
jgi:hypothetical protein